MIVFCILVMSLAVTQNQGSAVSLEGLTVDRGLTVELSHRAQQREKRCSCENKKDHECIFFCHIGIVWVNTPSHLVPYGFGSARPRREADRCKCNDARDDKCARFCRVHTQKTHASSQSPEKNHQT